MKKFFVLSLFAGMLMFTAGASKTEAACAAATGGLKVKTVNLNVLLASQSVTSLGNTGNNATLGNIFGGGIVTGSTTTTSTQVVSGNTNTTTYNITGQGGATNTTTVFNSGLNTTICTSAAN